jgi:hypothetical protein
MAMRIVKEEFHSIYQLMHTLSSRPNNSYMKNENDSKKGSESFTGTKNWEEAIKMLGTGYLEVIPKLQKNIGIQNKINAKYSAAIEKAVPKIRMQGYVPCVPNAIRGIPQSMISVDKKPMKRKTLHILYSVGANCSTETDWFVKAGTALLSAIDIIEKGGVQTKIDLNFFPSVENSEITFPTVTIKNYGERYSVQKISFPLAHPSMFRRIGFRWLETTPEIKQKYFGYGSSPSHEKLEEEIKINDPATYLISAKWIHSHNCSVEEILKKFGVI